MTNPAPVEEKPPKVTLIRAPDPLPTDWARLIANDVASRVREGWQPNRATRSLRSTRSSRDYSPTPPFRTPTPSVEVLWSQPYVWGVIDRTHYAPMLAWNLQYLDAASALQASMPDVDTFLKLRPKAGPAPAPFRSRQNRHGSMALRRNSDFAPITVAAAFLACASKATVWELDESEVRDFEAYWDVIEASITLQLIDDLFEE